MDCILTTEEEAVVARVGWARQERYLGKPEANVNYSEGDVWAHSTGFPVPKKNTMEEE
jgi:hypothetical protein